MLRAAMLTPQRFLFLTLLTLPLVACESSQHNEASPAPSASSVKTEPPRAQSAVPPPTQAEAAPPTAPKAEQPAPPDVAAAPATATKTASGLASRVLTPGTGKDHPGPDD